VPLFRDEVFLKHSLVKGKRGNAARLETTRGPDKARSFTSARSGVVLQGRYSFKASQQPTVDLTLGHLICGVRIYFSASG